MGAKVYRFQVEHHEYGSTIVESIAPESATMAAAKKWEAPWKEIAGYCKVTKLGTADKPRCKMCHKEYGTAGDPAAYCPDCLVALEIRRRDMARLRTPDRRAGRRERA